MNILTSIALTFRFFFKKQFSSLINITGLAIGLTGFTVVMLYIEHEVSYDTFHARYKDTYRIVKDFVSVDGSTIPDATTPPALSTAIRSSVAEVENVTRVAPNRGRLYLLQHEDKTFYETKLFRVDQDFFDVFDFKFIAGNKEKALDHIHSIILTESMAKKYFNKQDPIGKTIRMNVNNGTDYTVSGVIEDVPENSHFTFDLLIPFESGRNPDIDWQWSGFYTYATLAPNADPVIFEHHVNEIAKKHSPHSFDQYHVQAITDIHLKSHLKWELLPNGNITYIRILLLIGIFIILIACINYINLVTAQASSRAREVGVKKTIGAQRLQLVLQFLIESLLTVLTAFLLSLIFTTIILPLLTPITGVDLLASLYRSQVMIWILPILLVIGLVAGIYPSLYLSGFQTLKVLRGQFMSIHKGGTLRKALVVFQFIMSSGLIVGTLVVTAQLNFMRKKDLGFNHKNVLIVPNVRAGIGGQGQMQGPWDDMVRQVAGVKSISRADGILGATNAVNGVASPLSKSDISLNFIRVDYDFIPTMGVSLIDGRNFSEEFISDSTAIILNEQAVRELGLEEPVIGQKLDWDDDIGKTHQVTIVGVVRDFHFTDLHSAIMPFGFILEVGNGSNFFLRIDTPDLTATLKEIEHIWKRYNPGKPFTYSFQDDFNAQFHVNDARFESIFFIFTVLAILIACLGLFGLTVFLAESRTKEIGIRKIMGASVASILRLMSSEYIVIVLASLTIGFPASWYLMRIWLDNFAYHIDIGWQIFVVAGFVSLFLAMFTVSFHAIKVSTSNPVHSLRAE